MEPEESLLNDSHGDPHCNRLFLHTIIFWIFGFFFEGSGVPPIFIFPGATFEPFHRQFRASKTVQKTPKTPPGVPVFHLDAYLIFIDLLTLMFFSSFSPNFHQFQFFQRPFSGHFFVFFHRTTPRGPCRPDQRKITPRGPRRSDQRITPVLRTISCE